MEDIRIYKSDGSPLMVVSRYLHLSWEVCMRQAGAVKLTLPAPHKISDLLEREPYVILKWRDMYATVERVRYTGDMVIISAKGLLTLLARRVIPKDKFTLTGTGESCVRQLLSAYAPFLEIAPHTDSLPEKTYVFTEPMNVLQAANEILTGSGIGMDISFDKGVFTFSFVEKRNTNVRISQDNRNVHSISCAVPYGEIQNAGYCTEAFAPLENIGRETKLKDLDPSNYMKQYYLIEDIVVGKTSYPSHIYLYCDTPDGKLVQAGQLQEARMRYICYADNPLAVFEQDLRDLTRLEAEEILALRQYVFEDWSVTPENLSLSLGDIVAAEKTVGTEKGLKTLQVQRILYDTALSQTALSLVPLKI